jgi:hypothetical protein
MRIDPAVLSRLSLPHADRHALSRRRLLKAGAATTAAIAASGMLGSRASAAQNGGAGVPKPVPANPAFGGLHIYGVGPNTENSAITDFKGVVGAAIVDGSGIAKAAEGKSEEVLFDSDMRFMQGMFRDTDGVTREGTFAFV